MSDGFAASAGKAARPGSWWLSRLADACLLMGSTLYLALTLATFFGTWHWLPDLVTHFRPQLLALAAVLVMLLALARRLRWALPVLVAALVHGAVLMWPVQKPVASEPGPALRLVAFNLYFENTAFGPALGWLREQRPDILILSEASIPWQSRLDALADQLPYSTLDLPGGRSWDIVVMSRYPIRSFAPETPTDADGSPVWPSPIRLVTEVGGRPLVVWAVHPPSPVSPGSWQARNNYQRWVARQVAAEDPALPVIVAGDFNQTPWTPWHGLFLERSGLIDATGTSWPAATRRPRGGLPWSLLATPIDRVLLRPGIGVTSFAVGAQLGSDHNPVIADLVLGRPPRRSGLADRR
jgi:endonuclease/exonuclease/phosphatase (EEP) superfamily protein YafD